jgi:hypothetical protein
MYITSWRQPDIRAGTVYIGVHLARKSLLAARLPDIRKRRNGAQYARIQATKLLYRYAVHACTSAAIGDWKSVPVGSTAMSRVCPDMLRKDQKSRDE